MIYAGLSYRTFKRVKTPPSPAEKTNELKDLLNWVGCTLIIYFQEVMDWFLHWVPMYIFWKSLLILVVFSEKEITLRVLFSVEHVIVNIESIIDQQVSFISNFSTNSSLPLFKLLLTNSDLMVQGGSLDQLKKMETICDEYLERIKNAREKEKDPKALHGLSNIRMPSPEEEMIKCNVGIMTKKALGHGEKANFFPHVIKFTDANRELEWTAQGDDQTHKDTIKKVKSLSTVDRTFEIEMASAKKTIQFPDMNSYMQWASRLQVNITRTTTSSK